VAGAACAAVAALAAIDLLAPDPPGAGVVDRAVAAVTRAGVVYHVLEFTTAESPPRENAGEGRTEALVESWYTSDGRQHQRAFTVRDGQKGRLIEDFAGRRRPGRAVGSALRWDPGSNTISQTGFGSIDEGLPTVDPFEDPGAQLRALQQQGRLRLAGTTSVDDKRAYRLVSDEITVQDEVEETGVEEIVEQIEFTVDADSYLPLSQRVSTELGGRTHEVLTRYRIYERLALDDETAGLLALAPHPDAKCSESAYELTEERDLGFPNPCTVGGVATKAGTVDAVLPAADRGNDAPGRAPFSLGILQRRRHRGKSRVLSGPASTPSQCVGAAVRGLPNQGLSRDNTRDNMHRVPTRPMTPCRRNETMLQSQPDTSHTAQILLRAWSGH
jgi:hypothetical protein